MRHLILLSALLVTGIVSKAQVFGGNPSSLKFYQLTTDSVRVIFPKALEKQAREIAWTVHQLYKNNPAPLGNKLRRFDVVLQNQTTQSNAYVGIAPYRSEYFMMPPLNNISDGSIPWHLSLAVHEHRHMEQFANFNRTVPKLLNVFLGQEGTALGFGAAVPDWFFEGDAVWQETMVTQQGRGRLPNFFNAYRSLWQGNKPYSYMKLRNGSYRHFVPNHYDLGYLLVGYGREKYGADFWKKVTDDAVDYKGLIYPFQHAVKKHSGVKFKSFVNNAFDFYKEQMQPKQNEVTANFEAITPVEKNNVTSYQYPFVLNNGNTLVLKSSYRQIPVWISIDANGNQTKLRVKDIADDSYYSFRNDKVVYTAYEPHARWGWKDYSVIKVWDIASNEVIKVKSRSRLFQPDLNPDASKIVAMQYSTDMKSSLVLLPARAGTDGDAGMDAQPSSLPNPNNYLYTYPRFTNTNTIISAVRNQNGEMALLETDAVTNKEKIILPFRNTTISYVQVHGDSVLFTASQKEGDVLYLLKRSSNELFKLSQLPNGSYQAYFDGNTNQLLLNTFTVDGTRLLRAKASQLKVDQQQEVNELPQLYLSSKTFAASTDLVRNVQQLPGEISKYRKGLKLLNIHSWRPVLADPDYGYTFYSENIMNTLVSEYEYTYNRNEGYHRAAAGLIYGAWFPYLRGGVEQIWNRSFIDSRNRLISFNESNVNAGVSLPLNFTSGRTYKFLNISSILNFEKLSFTGVSKTLYRDFSFNYLTTVLSFTNQSQQAVQQIFPNWAQTVRLQHRGTINGERGGQFLGTVGLFFPALLKNHHLVLTGSLYTRDTLGGSFFSDNFSFSRGYNSFNFTQKFRLSGNYHLPLLYPEFGIGNIVYLLRVRANFFYDYTEAKFSGINRRFFYRSAGAEIYFDTKVWNLFPFSFGVRYSRLLDTDLLDRRRSPNQFEIIIPTNLF
jgi:hypothetical protein